MDFLVAKRDCSKDCIDHSPRVFDVHEAHFQLIRPDQSAFGGHSKITDVFL